MVDCSERRLGFGFNSRGTSIDHSPLSIIVLAKDGDDHTPIVLSSTHSPPMSKPSNVSATFLALYTHLSWFGTSTTHHSSE